MIITPRPASDPHEPVWLWPEVTYWDMSQNLEKATFNEIICTLRMSFIYLFQNSGQTHWTIWPPSGGILGDDVILFKLWKKKSPYCVFFSGLYWKLISDGRPTAMTH